MIGLKQVFFPLVDDILFSEADLHFPCLYKWLNAFLLAKHTVSNHVIGISYGLCNAPGNIKE